MQANPFSAEMVKMKLPAGAGDSVSVRGFALAADAEGCVSVPADVAAELEPHGLTRWAGDAPKQAKK